MKAIFVPFDTDYKTTYAKATEISKSIPKELFRGIVSKSEFDDATHKFLQNFEVRYAEPNEIETKLELTPEIHKWIDNVYKKGE